jgi:hypothetical protein
MNIQAATTQLKPFFRFPFQDSQARSRFIAGSALMLGGFIVPIVPGIFAYGYILRILRSSAEGEPPSMPAWDDWSSLFSLGLRGAVVNFVFLLPALCVFLLGFGTYFGTFFLVPLSEAAAGNTNDTGAFFALLMLGMAVMFFSMALGSILFLLGTVPLPASLTHFATNDRLGAAFRVREWWPILAANRLGYFISFVSVIGVLGIAYFAFFFLYSTLVLLCFAFLIIAPISFYAMLVGAALFGDAYREGHGLLQDPH